MAGRRVKLKGKESVKGFSGIVLDTKRNITFTIQNNCMYKISSQLYRIKKKKTG